MTNTLYVIEVKYQNVTGTAYEKIANAEYNLFFYEDLMTYASKDAKAVMIYIVNDYLKIHFPDVFRFLDKKGIKYFVDQYPPLDFFGF